MKQFEIGEIFKVTSGGTPSRDKPEYFENGDIAWVKTGDLKGKYINQPTEYISKAGLDNSSAKLFPPKTVLLAMYGATIGACSILPFEATTNQACAAFLPSESCDETYLYYYLTSIKESLVRLGVGGAQPNISAGLIKKIKIPLPPLAEQQKIATIFDAADSIRQKDRQLVESYTALSQSLFLEMFGDPVINPMGWDKRLFLDVFETKTGKLDSNAASESGSYPFFTCAKEILSIDSYSYDDEVLLLAGNNAAGIFDVKYYKGKFDAYQRTYILTINDNQLTYPFMQISLEKKLKDLQRLSIGSSTQYLTMKILGRLEFITPPIALQNQFAERIQMIEAQKQQAQASLEKSEALFNSLLQRAFTGEFTAKKAA